jgi:hypothetical protein
MSEKNIERKFFPLNFITLLYALEKIERKKIERLIAQIANILYARAKHASTR